MSGLSVEDSRAVLRAMATRAEDKNLAPEIVELLIAVADLEDDEDFGRAFAHFYGCAKWIEAALDAEEARKAGGMN